MANKIDKEVSRLQSSVRPGTGIREGIFKLRTICERATDVQKDVYICFIDYTKAFDQVKHFKMIECLSEIGIDDKDLQIITKLYWEQSASVRTESGMTSEFKIKKGAETWTLTKVTSDKLEAFEMWLYRRMLRISWKEHKTNGEGLHNVNTKRSLLNTIKKKEMSIFWTYNKRRWGTTIADGREDKW